MSVWNALWPPWNKVLVLPSSCRLPKVHPWLLGGHTFSQSNNITDEILELNKDILDALLDVNHSGIGKKTQLASALEDLDRKLELGLTLTKGKGWADQATMLIMQSFICLRSKQKNCHTGARYPQRLNSMFGQIDQRGEQVQQPRARITCLTIGLHTPSA